MRCVSESSLCASVSPIYLTLIAMNLPGYHPTRQTYFLVIPGSHEADLRPSFSAGFCALRGFSRVQEARGERRRAAERSLSLRTSPHIFVSHVESRHEEQHHIERKRRDCH